MNRKARRGGAGLVEKRERNRAGTRFNTATGPQTQSQSLTDAIAELLSSAAPESVSRDKYAAGIAAVHALLGSLSKYTGITINHETGARLDEPPADLRTLLARCPYRSIFSVVWPPTIRGIWSPDAGCALPIPHDILASLKESFDAGFGILLLCDDRATRDTAKAVLTAMLNPKEAGGVN